MKTFNNPNYNLSTDYPKLWELIKSGQRVPAWVLSYKNPGIWDIVEVKKPQKTTNNDEYMIGTRGISYTGELSYEGFIQSCTVFSLHFIDL